MLNLERDRTIAAQADWIDFFTKHVVARIDACCEIELAACSA